MKPLRMIGWVAFASVWINNTHPEEASPAREGLRAQIAVEEPVGAALVNGSSTIDFGKVSQGTSVERVVTIRNIGRAALTDLSISIDGRSHTDFAVEVLPAESEPASAGTANFSVTFSPVAPGERLAVLHIFSNDPDNSPFDVSLVGNAQIPVKSAQHVSPTPDHPKASLSRAATASPRESGSQIGDGIAARREPVGQGARRAGYMKAASSDPSVLELVGLVLQPAYVLTDTTVTAGGKRWRIGDTGILSLGSFSIYNETDNLVGLSIGPGGGINAAGNLTIDLGSGVTGIPIGSHLSLFGTNGAGVTSVAVSYGSNNGPANYYYNIGGTRAAPSATVGNYGLFALVARGHDGTALTGSKAAFTAAADGTWSATNNGTYFNFVGTPNGSTNSTEWARLANGSLMIGTSTLAGSERLRVAGGTVPGTPAASDVLIGGGSLKTGGDISAAGTITAAGRISTTGSIFANGGIQSSNTSTLAAITSSGTLGNDYLVKVSNTNVSGRGLRTQAGADTLNALSVLNAGGRNETFSVKGSGTTVIGMDPGGSELLRVGGSAHIAGGSVPGVAGATEVLIGAGQIKAGGAITSSSTNPGALTSRGDIHLIKDPGTDATLLLQVNGSGSLKAGFNMSGAVNPVGAPSGSAYMATAGSFPMHLTVSGAPALTLSPTRDATFASSVSVANGLRVTTGATVLGTDPGGGEILRVGGSVRANGLVGSGINPRMELAGTSRKWSLQSVDADGRFRIYDNTGSAERLTINANGNVGLGIAPANGRGLLQMPPAAGRTNAVSWGNSLFIYPYSASALNYDVAGTPGYGFRMGLDGSSSVGLKLISLSNVENFLDFQTGNGVGGGFARIAGSAAGIALRTSTDGTNYQTALMSDRYGNTIIGTDPGGTERLRVDGRSRFGSTVNIAPASGDAIIYLYSGASQAQFAQTPGNDCVVGTVTANGLSLRTSGAQALYLTPSQAAHFYGDVQILPGKSLTIGTDPGGGELLRVGGTAKFLDRITSASQTVGDPSYAVAGVKLLVQGPTSDTSVSSTVSTMKPQMSISGGNANSYLDLGVDNTPGTMVAFLQSRNVATGTGQTIALQPKGGSVILGTDPGGVDLLRVGGSVKVNGAIISAGLNVSGPISANNGLKVGGNVAIGNFGAVSPTSALAVAGTITAKEIKVNSSGADFVFGDEYLLKPLAEVADYVARERHLPGIPSASEMQRDGLSVSELVTQLLSKIEELTLYAIEADRTTTELRADKQSLREEVTELRKRVSEVDVLKASLAEIRLHLGK